jgi:hypothetical protein
VVATTITGASFMNHGVNNSTRTPGVEMRKTFLEFLVVLRNTVETLVGHSFLSAHLGKKPSSLSTMSGVILQLPTLEL